MYKNSSLPLKEVSEGDMVYFLETQGNTFIMEAVVVSVREDLNGDEIIELAYDSVNFKIEYRKAINMKDLLFESKNDLISYYFKPIHENIKEYNKKVIKNKKARG